MGGDAPVANEGLCQISPQQDGGLKGVQAVEAALNTGSKMWKGSS